MATSTPHDQPFLLRVRDINRTGQGIAIISGIVLRGQVKVGDELEIVGTEPTMETCCSGLAAMRQRRDVAETGQDVDIFLANNVASDAIQLNRLAVLATPGSIQSHTRFTLDAHIMSKDEGGGRHTPFFPGYQPTCYFNEWEGVRESGVTGDTIILDKAMVMPGEDIVFDIVLHNPVAMNIGDAVILREGGRKVGSGIVKQIVS